MKREMWNKSVFIIMVCGMLLLLPVMTQAQDDHNTPTENTVEEPVVVDATITEEEPEGVGVLILLLGLGGVAIVGGVMIGRDTYSGDGSTVAA